MARNTHFMRTYQQPLIIFRYFQQFAAPVPLQWKFKIEIA